MAEKGSYQVFINHRGPDTKRILAALLHGYLTAGGVRVFLDEKEIQTGDRNEDEIKEAIASSYVYIAIFSPRYAESSWCLEELCWMQEQPKSIFIPIFYNVKPSDVRHILRTFADAFTRHHENHRFEDQKLDKWKIALGKVPETKGEEFNPEDPRESRDIVQVVDKVVKMVLEEVWIKEPQEVAEHAVGLEQAAEEFENEISKQYKGNGIITVGIRGEGGSGKSTFVKYLYNMKRAQFEKSYLLSVASEKDCPSSQSLQRRLQRHPHLPIEDPSDGKGLLQQLEEHLEGFPKVLIILDELYNSKQIKSLLSLTGKLGDGSMVVVTSRDRSLLTRSKAYIFHDIKPLDDTNARSLFFQHAVGMDITLSRFEDSVQDVLGICEGLPLALQVLGEHFCGVTDQSWEMTRRSLDRQLPEDIKKILNPSYMSLDSAEKEVLLDVAYFFEGEDMDLVKRVLEGLDSSRIDCLDSLERKCLVKFENPQSKDVCTDQSRSPKNCLKMKRLVRDLARIKAREEFESEPKLTPLRLSWTDNRRISENDFPFPRNVRGIRISSWSRKTVRTNISGLKFLVLENCAVPFHSLSGDLVWLRLHNVDRNKYLSGPSLKYLRVMELKGVIHLKNLSIRLDDERPLKQRILPRSSRFSENPTVSFLVHLDLSGLSNLMELPDFISLSNLQYLALKDCSNLTTLELRGISTLECLDVEGCGELKSLNVEGLKSIKKINAAGCWKLQRIKGFGQLEALSYFNFSTASKLNNILPFPSNISTAILSVATSPTALDLVKEQMVEISQVVTFYDLSTTAETFLEYTSSNRVIVVCFIGERRSDFQVRFGCDDGQIKTFDAKGSQETLGSELSMGTLMMRIFMWTEDSEELKDLKFRGREVIPCTVQADNPLRGLETGVIMMSRNKCDGVELLKLLCLNATQGLIHI